MGLDTVIYFQAEGDPADFGPLSRLPPGFIVTRASEHAPAGATHELDNAYRYWGKYYPRGPGNLIAAALMQLFASEGVKRVWYGHDCEMAGPPEVTREDVLKLCEDYMNSTDS